MSQHRFVELLNPASSVTVAEPAGRLLASGFMVCPQAVQEWMCGRPVQWGIYQEALEQTLALARPSILDRLSASLNN